VIRRDGRRMFVGGPVTLANVASVLEEGRRHLHEGVRAVDLSEVTDMDSSLLAALLTWLRDARLQEHELAFSNLPEALQTISRLYGVDGLLPAGQTPGQTSAKTSASSRH
jgi:phospholipid transport system transporter-binding protein